MVVAGDEPQGLFSLGSLESTAAVRIPATLAEYNQRYPKIQFALATGPSGTMLDGVLDGTLNAAFVDGPITHPGLEGMPVYREEMMIVTPNGHPPFSGPATSTVAVFTPFAPTVPIAAILKAGFMPIAPCPAPFMKWSHIMACWPASLPARVSH